MKHICKRVLALVAALSLMTGLSAGLAAAAPAENIFAGISGYVDVDNSGAYPWVVSGGGSRLESGYGTGSGAITSGFTITAKTAGTLSFQYYLSLWGSNYVFYIKQNDTVITAIQGSEQSEAEVLESSAAVHVDAGDVLTIEFYKRFGFGANFAQVWGFAFESDCRHVNRTGVTTVDPTCTEDGHTSFHCEDCGLELTVVLPAAGHKGVLTEETDSYWAFHCSECGKDYQISKDPRLAAMTLTGVVVSFDDGGGGYPWEYDFANNRLQSTNYRVNSSTSAETITFSSDRAFQLSFDYEVSSEAGWDLYTVTFDGTVVADGISGTDSGSASFELEAGSYDLVVSYTKDSTAAGNGDRAYLFGIVAGPACEHLHTSEITVPATCISAGSAAVVCDDCGEQLSAAVLPALGHFGSVTYTGNGDGTHTLFCEREGCPGETAACTLEEGEVTRAPSCGESGERSLICSVCSDVVTVSIPAGGNHDFADGVCAVCGAKETWSGQYTQPAMDKDGTYLIGTADELAWFDYQSTRVSLARAAELASANVRLTADINMDGYDWITIGATESSGTVLSSSVSPLIYSGGGYTGTFDGDGHVIRNLTIRRRNAYETSARLDVLGLFGYATAAVIRDLGVEGAITVLDSSTHSAGDYLQIGGIVGFAQRSTEISGCYTNLDINAAVDYSVSADGTVQITGATNCDTFIGGIAGSITTGTTIENCYTLGTIRGECTRSISIGGIVGATRTAAAGSGTHNAVRKCYSAVDIYADPDATGVSASLQTKSYIGGMIGMVGSIDADSIPDVEYCFALNGVLDGGGGQYLYAGRLIGNGNLFQLAGKYNYALDAMSIRNAGITEYDADDSGYRSSWGRDISAERACTEAAYTNVLWNSEYNADADEYEETGIWNFVDGESYPRLAWERVTADTGYGKGDVNGDGYVNAVDAMLVLRAAAGSTTLTSAQGAAADVNGDGEINSADARLILCYSVGEMTAFE